MATARDLRTRIIHSVGSSLIATALLAIGAPPIGAQADLGKALIGKWEGEVGGQGYRGRDRAWFLVIESVKEGAAEASFGPSLDRLVKTPVTLGHDGTAPTLSFSGGGTPWKLTLASDKVMTGTAVLPGTGSQREFPVRFNRAK